jgi:hypothetical protein
LVIGGFFCGYNRANHSSDSDAWLVAARQDGVEDEGAGKAG